MGIQQADGVLIYGEYVKYLEDNAEDISGYFGKNERLPLMRVQ